MVKASKAIASNYELVRYQPDLKRQVMELQTHLWSPSVTLNTAYFEWKYERNPYVDKPLIYLALHNGRAVAMRGFFGVRWEAGVPTQQFTGLYADDMVIAPEHRNRGLISKIMTAALEDLAGREYDYVFNLSAGAEVFLSSLAMGWRSAGSVQPMYWRSWQFDVQSGYRRFIKRLPFISSNLDRLFSKWSAKSHRTLMDIDLERVRRASQAVPWISFRDVPRCAAMAELVERIGRSGRIHHVRDSAYFDWRFQNPLSRYRFLFWEKDRLEGYLVLQEYTSEFANQEMVNIVDWEASSVAVKADLLAAAFSFVKAGLLVIWSATLPWEEIALLRKHRFQFLKQPEKSVGSVPTVLVRRVRGERLDGEWLLADQRLADLASWDLRMLYSMRG